MNCLSKVCARVFTLASYYSYFVQQGLVNFARPEAPGTSFVPEEFYTNKQSLNSWP